MEYLSDDLKGMDWVWLRGGALCVQGLRHCTSMAWLGPQCWAVSCSLRFAGFIGGMAGIEVGILHLGFWFWSSFRHGWGASGLGDLEAFSCRICMCGSLEVSKPEESESTMPILVLHTRVTARES